MADEAIYLVYLAHNTVSGNEYIGQTGQGLAKRRQQHLYESKKENPGCWKFARALRKHGADAFVWTVIADGLSFEDAMQREIDEIAARKPRYNITLGGGGTRGIVHTPEARAKLHKPVLCLNDNRLFPSVKSAAEHYGTNQSAIGKVISFKRATAAGMSFIRAYEPMEDDDLRLMVLAEIEDRRVEGLARAGKANRRPVICVDTGVRYESATAAGLALGIDPLYVAQLANRGRALKEAGLRFRYEGYPEPLRAIKVRPPRPLGIRVSDTAKAKIGAKTKARGISLATRAARVATTRKKVFCPQLGTTFESVKAAAAGVGLHEKYVGLLARTGDMALRSDLTFKYIGEQ